MKIVELLLDKLFSWPGVVLFVILTSSLIFKKSLSGLIARVIKLKVGKEWVAIDTPADTSAAARQLESKPTETGLASESKPVEIGSGLKDVSVVTNGETENRLQQMKNFGVPPIVQEQENLIQNDLKKLNINAEESVKILVRHLAVTQLCLRAEFIYRLIFGSQIALLKFLNISGVATKAQLSQIYENAKAQFPGFYDNYSFEQYLQYLLTQILITTQDNEHYFMTVAGKEFLKWMTDARVSENKPF